MEMTNIVYDGTKYVCTVVDGTTINICYGTNKNSWNVAVTFTNSYIRGDLVYCHNKFWLEIYRSGRYYLYYSDDGLSWGYSWSHTTNSIQKLIVVGYRLFTIMYISSSGTYSLCEISSVGNFNSIATMPTSGWINIFSAQELSDYPVVLENRESAPGFPDGCTCIAIYDGSAWIPKRPFIPYPSDGGWWCDAICANGRIILKSYLEEVPE